MSENSNTVSSVSDNNGERYFLRDDTADITEDSDFGHYQYVQSIAETISEVEPPWQIALYGRWGTGKSSILEAIEDEFETDETVNEYIQFDAWKHAEDSIRTEFLLALNRKLGADSPVLPPEDIEEELLDVSVTETTRTTENDERSPCDRLKQWLGPQIRDLYRHFRDNIVVIVAILLFIGAHQVVTRLQTPIPNTVADILFLTFAGGALASELFRGIGGADTYQRMENPRQGWSGAYEALFKEILDKHGDDNESEGKYVIAIDNLDRCEPEAVYNVLISMKTFFGGEDNDCVYIVPCDADRLRDHVSAVNIVDGEEDLVEDEPDDEDEFLRKFFQTTIHLPPLEVLNLKSFATDQFEKLQADRRPDNQAAVVDVLLNLKSPTPRRVKHLINRFVSYRTLAERLEDAGLMKYNTVTEYEPFLMKTLIFQEDYNLVYRYIRTQPTMYTKLADIAATHDDVDSQDAIVASDSGINLGSAPAGTVEQWPTSQFDESRLAQRSLEDIIEESAGVLEFMQNTSEYDEENPEPFFYLGDASFAEIFGRYKQVKDTLEAGDVERAAAALDEISIDSQWELREFATDLYLRERDAGLRESTKIETAFELLGLLDDPTQAQALGRGFASELDEGILQDILSVFAPRGVWTTVWQGYIDEQDTVSVKSVFEYALSKDVADPDSIHREYVTAIFETVASADTPTDHPLTIELREYIASGLSNEPAATVQGVASAIATFDGSQRVAQAVMTEEFHEMLRQVLPAPDGQGVNEEVFEVLLAAEDGLNKVSGVDSPAQLTNELLTTVVEACLGSAGVDGEAYEHIERLRHIDLSRLTPNSLGIWQIHTFFAKHVQRSEGGLPLEVQSLLDLWLDLLDEDLLPYGQPDPDLVEDLDYWDDSLTVESTFTALLSIDNEDDRIRMSDGLTAEGRKLSVLNKNAILTAYLQNIPELVEDQDVITALELTDAGELAPLEEHLLTVCAEGESLGRWASIMVDLPDKAVGAQEKLVEKCIAAASNPGETNTAFVEYPALQWDTLEEQPALRERYIEVLKQGFATGQTDAQAMTAAALSQLDADVEIKPQLIRQAITTVRREYGRGERPATALDEFVEEQLAAGTSDGVPANTDLESLAEWRADFVRGDNSEKDRHDVFWLIISQFDSYADRLDSTTLQSVVNALKEEYPVEHTNPFAEKCYRAKQLDAWP